MEAFNRHKLTDNDEIQAYAAETYDPPLEILQDWSRPATSHVEAVEALKVALYESNGGCDVVVQNMIKAALPVFDRQTLAEPAADVQGSDRSANRATAGRLLPAGGTVMGVKDLSFVANRDGKALPNPIGKQSPRCFWNVASTGDYGLDCDIGQRLALEYLRYEEAAIGGGGILQLIVNDMPRPLTGVETAFLQMVAFQARAGRGRARQIATYWDQCAARPWPR